MEVEEEEEEEVRAIRGNRRSSSARRIGNFRGKNQISLDFYAAVCMSASRILWNCRQFFERDIDLERKNKRWDEFTLELDIYICMYFAFRIYFEN